MLLALNINNTLIKIGTYQDAELVNSWRIATAADKTDDEYAMVLRSLFDYAGLPFSRIESVAISCVVPSLTDVFDRLSRRYFGVVPLIVGPGVKTGIRILYENPKEVGADRICNAIAVYEKYGGPAIVVDFGTATTFTVVSADGDFLGGAIAPGVGISMDALAELAQLRRVELVRPPSVIARSTVTALQSGILYGVVGQVEEIIGRMLRELGGRATTVATGGWAELVIGECRCFDHHDPLLTLDGLRIIHERNRALDSAQGGSQQEALSVQRGKDRA